MKVRRLGPGDEDVVRSLATQGAPARVSELLADERTVLLAAFDREAVIGFLLAYQLTNESNGPAMALYDRLGGQRPNQDDVLWDFVFE